MSEHSDQSPKGSLPASVETLWELAGLFIHDWTSPVTMRNGYATDLTTSQSLLETRSGSKSKPYREIEASIKTFDVFGNQVLRSIQHRAGHARQLVPIYCDHTRATMDAGPADTVLNCDTRYRRFFAGQHVIARSPATQTFAVAKVDTVDPDFLVLESALGAAVPVGAHVYPTMECDVRLEQDAQAVTDIHHLCALQAREATGLTALPASAAAGEIPDGFNGRDGLPILAEPTSWDGNAAGLVRPALTGSSGIQTLYQLKGTRPLWTIRLPYLAMDRERAWRLLQLFDSRRGRVHPLYCATGVSDLELASVTGSTATFKPHWVLGDWAAVPYVAMHRRSTDTVSVHKVLSYSVVGGNHAVVTDAAFPTTVVADVKRMSVAIKGRLGSDELQETWRDDKRMRTELSVVEVRDAASSLGAGYDPPVLPPPPPPGPPELPPPGDPGVHCGDCPLGTTPQYVYWQVAFPIDVTSSCGTAAGGNGGGYHARKVSGGPLDVSVNYPTESRINPINSGTPVHHNWRLPQVTSGGNVCQWKVLTGYFIHVYDGDWSYNPCTTGDNPYAVWAIVERRPGNVWRAFLGAPDTAADWWTYAFFLFKAEWTEANCNVDTALAKTNVQQGGFNLWTDPYGPPFAVGTNGSSHFFFRNT
jgi:hypothetical protein